MQLSRHLIAAVLLASCSPPGDGCVPDGDAIRLDDDVREASGIASSRTHRDYLWVHNDSDGGATVFALDLDGNMSGRAHFQGAQNRDWEDLAVAPCPAGGPQGDCLFVADIGDNRAVRNGIGVWVAAEPDPRVETTVEPQFFRFHYPDGPRDAEALAVLSDGSLLIVSKGREHPITAYRSAPLAWPRSHTTDSTLVAFAQLSDGPVELPVQITGASMAPDGRLALRSYSTLQFYTISADGLASVLEQPVALDSLSEPQGEGITVGRGGRVVLVSEAGPQGIAARLTPLRCRLP